MAKVIRFWKKRYTVHASLVGLVAVVALQGQAIGSQDTVFYALFAGEEISEGPLDPNAYAQSDTPGIGGARLAAADGGLGIDLITLDDPEVIAPLTLSGNVVVAPLSPVEPDPSQQSSQQSQNEINIYEVQSGDTIGAIAEQFNVSEDTIRWANGFSKNHQLKVGDHVTILPTTGVLHAVKSGDTLYGLALEYEVSVAEIASYNGIDQDAVLALGAKLIVPGGVRSAPAVTSPSRLADGPTPEPIKVTGSGLIRPVSGYLSQAFGRYGHSGADIAGNAGQSIYASAAGTVTHSGWLGGYGQRVVVDHGNGLQTLYAHTSANYVKTGQTVNKGDAIAKVGSTGRSTGYHLHFEVIKNGSRINPCNVVDC